VTAGNAPDNEQFAELVARDRAQGLAVETYAADRGYDDTENHYLLESLGLHSAIRLKRTRTEKRDRNKEVWMALQATPQYQAGQDEKGARRSKDGPMTPDEADHLG
jgi:hypothetical protein